MSRSVLVTYAARAPVLAAIADVIGGAATVRRLTDFPEAERVAAVQAADAFFTQSIKSEFRPTELAHADRKLVQLMYAGVDRVPFDLLPSTTLIAHNGGAFAEQMAEHVLAMALAGAKKLLDRHVRMAKGDFDQFGALGTLRDGACAIIGYGAIGRETARLVRPFGMRVYGLNRSGRTTDNLEFIGTLEDLEPVLRAADLVVLSLGLNRRTHHLIGARELSWMKKTAIIVNVARGAVIDEAALYAHLKATPEFTACLDAWWIEPLSHGRFEIGHPFFDLPNVLGSPHNSAQVAGYLTSAARHAAKNVRRYLAEGRADRLVGADDRH